MKLMILGYARHGKDTVCEILRDRYGMNFVSSSQFVAERAVRPWLAERGITYRTYEAMYEDRVNHRAAWFDAITAYNTPDRARLGRELFAEFDIYAGIRNREEYLALRRARVFDFALWVDASDRKPPESADSCTLRPTDAHYIVDNNGPVERLPYEIAKAFIVAVTATAHDQANRALNWRNGLEYSVAA